MSDRRYNEAHLWAMLDEFGMVLVGISEHAQEQLGDIVYVELPDVGREIDIDEEVALIESVKTTSDICTPVSGTVHAINQELADSPETINESALDEGWLFRIEPRDENELSGLLDEDAYNEFVAAET
jgi:glycine cleavage system H protein